MMAVIEIKNVTKIFNKKKAVDNLSLTLDGGEILGLIGQNGAGKSTTFKMILNFLKPDGGDMIFNGRSISYNDLDEIGFLPEERGLYEDLKVEEEIKYFSKLHGYSQTNIDEKIDFWIKKLNVKGTRKDKVKNLSKGNQQKIQLICSFIHEPKLLILDEPFSGLDPVNAEILIEAVIFLKNSGTAIIFSSHNMQNVENLSDKILMIKNGVTVLSGKVNDIKNSFGKKLLYIEGDFNTIDLENMDIKKDGTGYLIKFDDELQAREYLEKQKKFADLKGYKLMTPSLNEIFKDVAST